MPHLDRDEVLAEAADATVRFGRHLESHKRGTVDFRSFFRGDSPSILARRRLTKLSAGVGHVLTQLIEQQVKIRDAQHWIDELTGVVDGLRALEKQQRSAKVQRVDLGPEMEAGRQAWLAVYNGNKLLIRGLLAHAGKPELLPLIFDDLAEVHRAGGVSDEVPEGEEPDEGSAPADEPAKPADEAAKPADAPPGT